LRRLTKSNAAVDYEETSQKGSKISSEAFVGCEVIQGHGKDEGSEDRKAVSPEKDGAREIRCTRSSRQRR